MLDYTFPKIYDKKLLYCVQLVSKNSILSFGALSSPLIHPDKISKRLRKVFLQYKFHKKKKNVCKTKSVLLDTVDHNNFLPLRQSCSVLYKLQSIFYNSLFYLFRSSSKALVWSDTTTFFIFLLSVVDCRN